MFVVERVAGAADIVLWGCGEGSAPPGAFQRATRVRGRAIQLEQRCRVDGRGWLALYAMDAWCGRHGLQSCRAGHLPDKSEILGHPVARRVVFAVSESVRFGGQDTTARVWFREQRREEQGLQEQRRGELKERTDVHVEVIKNLASRGARHGDMHAATCLQLNSSARRPPTAARQTHFSLTPAMNLAG